MSFRRYSIQIVICGPARLAYRGHWKRLVAVMDHPRRNYLRRFKRRNRTTTTKITMVPGQMNQPRPLLYPPATMHPDENIIIDKTSPSRFISPSLLQSDSSHCRFTFPMTVFCDGFNKSSGEIFNGPFACGYKTLSISNSFTRLV